MGKKIKKEKVMVLFDQDERKSYLKSKFGSKKKRKQIYLKQKEEKEKENKRKEREEIRKERKEEIEKYQKVLEEHQKLIDEIEANKKAASSVKMKAGGSKTVKITTTYL